MWDNITQFRLYKAVMINWLKCWWSISAAEQVADRHEIITKSSYRCCNDQLTKVLMQHICSWTGSRQAWNIPTGIVSRVTDAIMIDQLTTVCCCLVLQAGLASAALRKVGIITKSSYKCCNAVRQRSGTKSSYKCSNTSWLYVLLLGICRRTGRGGRASRQHWEGENYN